MPCDSQPENQYWRVPQTHLIHVCGRAASRHIRLQRCHRRSRPRPLSYSKDLSEEDGVCRITAEVYGNGIDMWLRSQESVVKIVEE
jgi:hypothetical protein